MIALADVWLADLDFGVASSRNPDRRGGHVSLRHDDAWQLTQALLRTGVIADYRTPDRIRLAPAPLYTSFTQVWDGMDRLREIAASKSYADIFRSAHPAELAKLVTSVWTAYANVPSVS